MIEEVIKQQKNKQTQVNVLDKGFVKIIEFMGGDLRVVDSARVTFGSVSKGEDRDKKLIQYLLSHAHYSPFEHSVFQLHIKCPIFVARQWMRHRWGSYNEVSARYTEVKDEFYIPESFRVQDTVNKQGSVISSHIDQSKILREYENSVNNAFETYNKLIKAGVAKEMARMVLPVAQYTQFYWSVNARSLLNFISLRTDCHAQQEIQVYANAITEIFKEKMPWTWEAFESIFLKNKQTHDFNKNL